MNTLSVYMKDCYGIGELNEDFNFSLPLKGRTNHKQTSIIYAHNGIMKTSFANTFHDVSQGLTPHDAVLKRVPTVRINADGNPLDPDSIFVVASHSSYFESDKMMTLLADKKTQQRYVEIIQEINTVITALFDSSAAKIGLTGADRSEKAKALFDERFKTDNETRLNYIISMKNEVAKANPDLLNVNYKIINDSKVDDFLAKASTHLMLKDYVAIYEELIKQSKYFSEEIYDYNNAADVQKSMKKNNFMKAKNRVVLVSKTGEEVDVSSSTELERLYSEDKNAIFKDLQLKQQYEKFDTEIGKNESMRGFRDWVKKNQNLIPRLQNVKGLKQSVWQSYFGDSQEIYDAVIDAYEQNKEELATIYERSDKLQSEWQDVVDKFNESFVVPFEVKIKNKKDVVLNRTKPELEFHFTGDRSSSPTPVNVDVLVGSKGSILSRGESRALFILCVMFEIESRKKDGKEHLIIFDDIADSFDYKNKYAIIEYLHGLSNDSANKIHMIILTHNFDFFRAFRLRCSSYRSGDDKAKIATRSGRGVIKLNDAGEYNEFDRLKKESKTNVNAFLSLIPFARNLLEYANGTADANYLNLTWCLHYKSNTNTVTIKDVALSIQAALGATVDLSAYNKSDKYVDLLDKAVKGIIAATDEMLIEHKIVLSLAIRIEVESYIQATFTKDGSPLKDEARQTGAWFGKFVDSYAVREKKAMSVLNRAVITTPEAIHLNSFMYEPIMDLSVDDLVKIYTDLKSL